ncbi:MAG: rhomboid family intramembrane serine protease [Desulfuromonadaceae bacterium]|nr:rhomboid family intramembrane serine protease [Desulfuromonas sp.]MDY0213326.1 rhomboid family intramembrane serine protease [Desulfuromonadaceae bacterium]
MNWKKKFDSIGLNGTKWQWRIVRWQHRAEQLRRGNNPFDISASKILLLVNLVLFSALVLRGATGGHGLASILTPDIKTLLEFGAQWWPLVIDQGQWWRCVTYAFSHGGLIHLAFNMMVLYQVGPQLEREIGIGGFTFLYLFTALAATILGLFWHPTIIVVGASGALFGLIGFSVTYFHRVGGRFAHAQRDFMLKWAVFAFIFGLLLGADNAAHLGGALSGAVLGAIFPISIQKKRALTPLINFLFIGSGATILLSLAMLVASWF